MSTGDPKPYNYCDACCGPCRVHPDPFFAPAFKLKLADCEVRPKMGARHQGIFDVEKKVGDFYFLEYRRTRLLQKAKTILTNDAARAPYEPDITIPRDEMLKALEYGLNETEDKMVTELCELRDLIFEALGKLDYRPPIEAEA